jgi:hypothetical protein
MTLHLFYLPLSGLLINNNAMKTTSDEAGRFRQRRHLLYYLDVLNAVSGRSVGRLGDITREGLLLLTRTPPENGTVLRISLSIPPTIDPDREQLAMSVEVRWRRNDNRPGFFAVGCSITDIVETDRTYIDRLIDRIGFSDGTKRIFLKNDQNVFLDTEDPSGHR